MCDSATLIEEILDRKVQNSEMFTAYDVTLAVQAELKLQNKFDSDLHRHRHLKNDIHVVLQNHIRNGNYHRTTRDVGAAVDAFVYFPLGANPANYVPLLRKDKNDSNDPYTINVVTVNPQVSSSSVALLGYDDDECPKVPA